jgi:hypothetical protein
MLLLFTSSVLFLPACVFLTAQHHRERKDNLLSDASLKDRTPGWMVNTIENTYCVGNVTSRFSGGHYPPPPKKKASVVCWVILLETSGHNNILSTTILLFGFSV